MKQKWERYEMDGRYYFRPIGKYATDNDRQEPDTGDAPGCIYGVAALIIAIFLILGVAFKSCAQPQIWAGANRAAIERAMAGERWWFKSPSPNDKLIYKSLAGEVIIYHFNKTGINWKCTGCSITLPDSTATEKFISERVAGYRLLPDGEGWQLLTDLTDTKITVIRKGNTLIYSF